MTEYSVRFNRDTKAWTCSVVALGANGAAAGPAVATGTGRTKDDAKEMALTSATDPAIRAALTSADHARPYWMQGALGEQQDAQQKAASHERTAKKSRK